MMEDDDDDVNMPHPSLSFFYGVAQFMRRYKIGHLFDKDDDEEEEEDTGRTVAAAVVTGQGSIWTDTVT